MRLLFRWGIIAVVLAAVGKTASAQDLAPRAYLVAPIHSNAITLSYGFYNGNLDFGNVPITDATARASVSVLSYSHSLNFFGRTAMFLVSLPYGTADFRGRVLNTETNAYRSGLLDSVYRFSVNLKGGPAMRAQEYGHWHQKTIIGASFRIVAPTGQYDSTKLINWGNNRWGFKPEIGLSRRWGDWVVDGYGGAWFYTTNAAFFSRNRYNPGITAQKQAPIVAFEGHLSYDIKPRLWVSFDANFWFGGETSLNSVGNPASRVRNSRIGGSASLPITKRHSIKLSYSNGAYIKYGGNFQNISMGWQYSWLGRPN